MTDLGAKPYDVTCGKCSAPPRAKCRDGYGNAVPPHQTRIETSQEQT